MEILQVDGQSLIFMKVSRRFRCSTKRVDQASIILFESGWRPKQTSMRMRPCDAIDPSCSGKRAAVSAFYQLSSFQGEDAAEVSGLEEDEEWTYRKTGARPEPRSAPFAPNPVTKATTCWLFGVRR